LNMKGKNIAFHTGKSGRLFFQVNTQKAALLLLLPILLCSCATKDKTTVYDFQAAPLFGMIYDHDNTPCSNVRTRIDGTDGPVSDINGRFIVQSLSRGEHHIVFTKEGYETESLTFQFLNINQVLYVRMISFEQLLEKVEDAIEYQRWEEGEELLQRAEQIKQNNPLARYLHAILLKEKGNAEKAVKILLGILHSGFKGPYVYLALGDLYQYRLQNIPEAARYLEEYLELEVNREVQKRLEELKREMGNRNTEQ
jgi:tetratricopeptide (TPR) repeat protein